MRILQEWFKYNVRINSYAWKGQIKKKEITRYKVVTPSIISNQQTVIVRRENTFCKFHTFSILFTMFLFTMIWNKK